MLEALYTDSCEHSMLGKIAKALGPLTSRSLKRLANRKVHGIPKEKIYTSDTPLLNVCNKKSPEYKWQSSLSKNMITWKEISDKTIIYNMYCENLDYLKYAKNRGGKILIDVYMNPCFKETITNECNRLGLTVNVFNGINTVSLNNVKESLRIADILLCPSEFVAAGVREFTPKYADKIRICPYGSSINYNNKTNKPIKGRVFWAGSDWLGKGLHYLAEAADELKKKHPEMEFRAAGITNPAVMQMERFKNITFLGKLNKQQIQEEYLSADAFVFPTLSEGMAGVVLEAIAAGCPVITTEMAGIDGIKNGINGIIIPPKDSNAILKGVEDLYLNRSQRDSISQEGLLLAAYYSESAWSNRLIRLIESMN